MQLSFLLIYPPLLETTGFAKNDLDKGHLMTCLLKSQVLLMLILEFIDTGNMKWKQDLWICTKRKLLIKAESSDNSLLLCGMSYWTENTFSREENWLKRIDYICRNILWKIAQYIGGGWNGWRWLKGMNFQIWNKNWGCTIQHGAYGIDNTILYIWKLPKE